MFAQFSLSDTDTGLARALMSNSTREAGRERRERREEGEERGGEKCENLILVVTCSWQ